MSNRYWQIGIIAIAVVLVAVALITAKTTAQNPENTAIKAEASTIELGAKDVVPAKGPISTDAAPSASNYSKVELDVQGMSCSGCINEIKSSLAPIVGVGDVLVDLSGGKVDVFYDDEKVKDVGQIASAITAVGYPATVTRKLTEAEIAKENNIMDSRSKLYIAAVGDWEIARSDFDIELTHARARYEQVYGKNVFGAGKGAALMQRLKSQVASRLISEGIQMQEVQKAGFKVSPETVQSEFNTFLSQKGLTPDSFKRVLDDSGYEYAYFLKKFENQVTINHYVEEKILLGVSNDIDKQEHYSSWYNNARLLAQVVYYDRQLESIAKSSSGGSSCGSSCTKK